MLGLTLDLIERTTNRQKNGTESAARVCRKCWVAMVFRHLEGTARRVDPFSKRPSPRDHNSEEKISASPKVIQSATFEQIASHLSESIPLIVVAEPGAGDHGERLVIRRCRVAVAVLQAEIGSPADNERAQVRVGV